MELWIGGGGGSLVLIFVVDKNTSKVNLKVDMRTCPGVHIQPTKSRQFFAKVIFMCPAMYRSAIMQILFDQKQISGYF